MAIVVEDGTIVANANSYVTVAETTAYATARGVTLDEDSVVETQLIRAMDYLEAQGASYKGCKVNPAEQVLQWPRKGVEIEGTDYPSNKIPNTLKQAQMRLVVELTNGVDIMPTRSGGFVKREKVDVIETEYSEAVGVGIAPEMTAVDALLQPLYATGLVGMSLSTVRV